MWLATRVGVISANARRNPSTNRHCTSQGFWLFQIPRAANTRKENHVSIDFLHTSFGILFTFVWLFVGQILVASR